jgi:predicted hydrolase (HD superfamily)
MMVGLTEDEAHLMLQGNSKYFHSILVSRIMEALSKRFNVETREWALVGLIHDLDHDIVQNDMARHGSVSAQMLEGKLSSSALRAIKSHDYRSGLKQQNLMERALVFADSLAVLIEDQKLKIPISTEIFFDALRNECNNSPWIGNNILKFAEREGVAIQEIINELAQSNLEGYC